MAYAVPSIGVAGLTIPLYQDILDYLVAEKKRIYGEDIYLGEDTTDYQELSVFALFMYDTLQAIQLVYNNRSPLTAIGSGLDGVVKINGIARHIFSYSTVDLLITGVVGTTIVNGVATDTSGQKWNLPASVTIPGGGQVQVNAMSDLPGAIQALAGTITKIGTPQSGWTSVNNLAAAVSGMPVELDSELRARQEISTAISAISPMDSLLGGVSAVDGVGRIKGYQNDTVFTDINGVPAHSISIVVEGGDSVAIAEAINLKKTMGVGTYGSTTVNVSDYVGNVIAINFYHVIEVSISVKITIESLSGYSAAIGAIIKDAIAACINDIDIGEDVYITKIIAAASLYGTLDAETFRIIAVELGRPGDSPFETSVADVVIDFNEMAICSTGASPDDIELVVT